MGYVANSTHTVVGDCCSAGRIYDKIGDTATAKVKYVLDKVVVCKVKISASEKIETNPDTGLPYGSEIDSITF